MGAGTSPADGRHADDTQADGPAAEAGEPGAVKASDGARASERSKGHEESVTAGAPVTADGGADADAGVDADKGAGSDADKGADVFAGAGEDGDAVDAGTSGSTWAPSRRFSLTRDTARPEGGGRAAPGDAPAPARQWPLLTVLCTAGLGLLIVGADPFAQAFRVGTMLMGVALLAGAVLRWVVPSVGMLAVRSRFTDLVTYGSMGTLIVLLALMAQPKPWLQVPFLQDVVHFTIR
ncbi:DUF3017 domain-containing protein [Streptomyces sp. NPDC056749]|uniref:DUF3017 domain-containing protein n=1 Tax=Streptomyces sp. NPDC056749 TaxID=3345936 RepID=UPI0036807439